MAIGILPLGFHPFATLDAVPLVPKQRYHIMDAYMPQVGTMGRHMMTLTCSTQVTIDFHSEADAMRKLQLASKLTPFFVALSANSAVQEGQYSGRASTRAYAWVNTDPVRTGFPDCVVQPQARFKVSFIARPRLMPLKRSSEPMTGQWLKTFCMRRCSMA